MKIKGMLSVLMIVSLLGLVGCGRVRDTDLDSNRDSNGNQWGNAVFIDDAVFKGMQGEYALFELKNSPKQYSIFHLTPDMKGLLSDAQFPHGKELVIKYRAGQNEQALLEAVNQQGIGERLEIAAGTFQEVVNPQGRLVVLSTPGALEEFYVETDVYDNLLTACLPGEDIVAYYRKEGTKKVIVSFEQN